MRLRNLRSDKQAEFETITARPHIASEKRLEQSWQYLFGDRITGVRDRKLKLTLVGKRLEADRLFLCPMGHGIRQRIHANWPRRPRSQYTGSSIFILASI